MKNTAKYILASACAALIAPTTAFADHHGNKEAASGKASPSIAAILNSETRKEDAARDKYRHPLETLAFFRIAPTQTVVEYGPGGGWYTRVLLPYLAPMGKYVAVNGDSASLEFSDRAREARTKSWPENFPAIAGNWTGLDPKYVSAFESDEMPKEMLGTVDRIFIFRAMHGMMNGNRADSELQNLRKMLKDDGMIGIVQHRANEDATYAFSNGSKGYLRQSDVIALFKANGFELVDSSEINANPKDTKDYEGGVWTLPPVRGADKENDAKYQAIGESDRMTLLFKKRP